MFTVMSQLTVHSTTFFVVAFSTFLLSCIDYSKLTASVDGPNAIGRLDDVLIGQCLTR
jgi:autophagy-related protein 9